MLIALVYFSGFCIALWKIWCILILYFLFVSLLIFLLNLWKLLGASYPECSEIENMQLYHLIHYVCINQSLYHENKYLSVLCSSLFEVYFSRLWSFSFWNLYYSNQLGCCLILLSFPLYIYYTLYYFWGIFHECISKIPIDFLKSLQSKFNLIFSPEFLLIVKCFLLHFKCFDLVLDFSPLMTLGWRSSFSFSLLSSSFSWFFFLSRCIIIIICSLPYKKCIAAITSLPLLVDLLP